MFINVLAKKRVGDDLSALCTFNIPRLRICGDVYKQPGPEVVIELNKKRITKGLTPPEAIAFEKMARVVGKQETENTFLCLCEWELDRRQTLMKTEKKKEVISRIPEDVKKDMQELDMLPIFTELGEYERESVLTKVSLLELAGTINQDISRELGVLTTALVSLFIKPDRLGEWVRGGIRKMKEFVKDDQNVALVLSVAERIVGEVMDNATEVASHLAKE